MLFELLGAALLLGCTGGQKTPAHRRNPEREFEEFDSFFDKDGNEHIIDDEGYCEECDDYHDDY